MKLTRQARPNASISVTDAANTTTTLAVIQHDSPDAAFPTIQLFILALCRLAEPIALTSIFPYSWIMVRDFDIGLPSNASFYAGILISAFSLSESLTGMFWGGLSDRVGRKPILLFGCVGTTLSLLIVGFSTSFWVALFGRVLGGILNGNMGVIQTMVGELVKRPEHEPRAYAVMPFVWSIGTIIGPAIGGYFARPADSFPGVFSRSGIFGTFPYLLPNLICAFLQLMSIIAGYMFLEETHPDLLRGAAAVQHPHDFDEFGAPLSAVATAGSTAHASADLRVKSYGTFNDVDMHQDEEWDVKPGGKSYEGSAAKKTKVFTYRVTMLVIALGIFTYHSMTYDHLLPIFLQDDRTGTTSILVKYLLKIPGGLGLSVQTVGLIMAVNGVIALLIQAIVFPLLAEWLGVWNVFVLVTVLHPIAYFIVPFLTSLPQKLLFPGIYTCLTIRNFFSILAYPVLLILIKQACPSHSVIGKINGLAASAGAACRTIAPPIAGYLYSIGSRIEFTGLAWWGSAMVAIVGACQLYFMHGKKHTAVSVTAPSVFLHHPHQGEEEVPLIPEVIHVTVHDNT
ncbi:MFS transporter [Histoplasma capsulatum var. duboisii H88]|uniref:MFS transporter n=1 Tax=Ajellomyces capsulatus (strain H88) TaxID=544711 RepID=F0URD9_AJEC8|nr:MFS transporter [Histoplasma capsulatum var. duboisii H88]QSS50486.1 MFS transporter [Histoplasma capsulatum var. duboisii H88]